MNPFKAISITLESLTSSLVKTAKVIDTNIETLDIVSLAGQKSVQTMLTESEIELKDAQSRLNAD